MFICFSFLAAVGGFFQRTALDASCDTFSINGPVPHRFRLVFALLFHTFTAINNWADAGVVSCSFPSSSWIFLLFFHFFIFLSRVCCRRRCLYPFVFVRKTHTGELKAARTSRRGVAAKLLLVPG